MASELETSLGQELLNTMPVKVLLAQPDATELANTWQPLSDIMSGEQTPPDTPTDADPEETSVKSKSVEQRQVTNVELVNNAV